VPELKKRGRRGRSGCHREGGMPGKRSRRADARNRLPRARDEIGLRERVLGRGCATMAARRLQAGAVAPTGFDCKLRLHPGMIPCFLCGCSLKDSRSVSNFGRKHRVVRSTSRKPECGLMRTLWDPVVLAPKQQDVTARGRSTLGDEDHRGRELAHGEREISVERQKVDQTRRRRQGRIGEVGKN